MVPSGFFYPADIVVHLVTDIIRSLLCKFTQYLDGQRVALGEIFRILRHAYPSERAETVVEIERSHDVFHIGRIAESPVFLKDVGAGTRTLEKESIAVVEEVHALGGEFVDGFHLTP